MTALQATISRNHQRRYCVELVKAGMRRGGLAQRVELRRELRRHREWRVLTARLLLSVPLGWASVDGGVVSDLEGGVA